MKINDFYNMETIQFDKEWRYSNFIQELFDISFDYSEIDEKYDKLVIETKLEKNVDSERGITYKTITYNGIPFCLKISSGRGWNENERHYVTCSETFNLAKKYVLEAIAKQENKEIDITSKDEEIDNIDSEYGYFVYFDTVDGKNKLVNKNSFVYAKNTEDYCYVLDEEEIRNSFENNVRKIYNNLEDDKNCINNKEFMNLYRNTIMNAVRVPDADKIVINNKDSNIIGAIRYKDKFFYVGFPSWYKNSLYLTWALDERIEPISFSSEIEEIKKLFV